MLSVHEIPVCWQQSIQPPSVDDILTLLHDCRNSKNASQARSLQMHIHNSGLECHDTLGNHLVSTLAQCGSMIHADLAFSKLVHPNEHSWTCLIQGYVDAGDSQHAFGLFQSMKSNGICPSNQTYVALLKACAQLKSLSQGQYMHIQLAKQAADCENFIGNTLVDMYVNCGCLIEAEDVFGRLVECNVVSWSALIKGYADHALAEKALICLEQMQSQGLQPDAVTFVCCLKSCHGIGDVQHMQQIHKHIIEDGYENQTYVGNVLVDLYAQFGFLAEAVHVFKELPDRSLISWTALMTGYTEHGLGHEALECLEQLQSAGFSADAVTFVCSLKACSILGAADKGLCMYAEMVKDGFETDPRAGTAFIDMCSKCGLILEAQEGFDELSVQDLISWNTLIMAYVEHGQSLESLDRLQQMKAQGVAPNAATYVSAVKASGCLGELHRGRAIHAEIAMEGYEGDPFVLSSLIDMYAKGSQLAEAEEVFHEAKIHNVVAWNTLMSGYAHHECWKEVLVGLEHMQLEEVRPDAVTYVCGLQACGSTGHIDKAWEIHADAVKEGFEDNAVLANALVDMYAKCGSLVEACAVFESLCIRDVVAWNAMILGHTEQGEDLQAVQLYSQMLEQGLMPDTLTFTGILKACGSTGAIDAARRIHVCVLAGNVLDNEKVLLQSALIDMYSKCGSMADAQGVFDMLPERDLVRWTALMNGYARQGASEVVLEMFERMLREGRRPNGISFLSVFVACRHIGLLERGKKYFELMCREYGITPTVEHQNCMVDMFGRVRQLDEGMAVLEASSLQTNCVTWNSVLGTCEKGGVPGHHSKQAFKGAVESDLGDAGAFVLMSNLYADGQNVAVLRFDI